MLYFRDGNLVILSRDLQPVAEFPENGNLARIYGTTVDGTTHWSPDSSRIVYYAQDADTTRVVSPVSAASDASLAGYRPIAWLDEETLVVAQGTWSNTLELAGTDYNAFAWNIATQTLNPLPALDYDATSTHGQQLWLIASERKAVTIVPATVPKDSLYFSLQITDIDTGATTVLDDSRIGFPSEGIPWRAIWRSSDGTALYWSGVGDGTSIQRASLTTLIVEDIATGQSFDVKIAPDDGAVAYATYDSDLTARLFVESLDDSGKVQLAVQQTLESGVGASMPFAWRPAE